VPPASERGLSGSTSTAGAASSGSNPPPGAAATGEAKARIVAGPGGVLDQNRHGAYVCKLIGSPTISLSSAESSMPDSSVALAVNANESGTTVLQFPVGENNLATYCTDPGGVGPSFTGTSAAFVVTEGGSTDVEITATPRP
jgi:hypothetical protein